MTHAMQPPDLLPAPIPARPGQRIAGVAPGPRGHGAQRGFTLSELVTVVAIVGILLAVALPAYGVYKVKANRAAVKTLLLEAVSRQEQYAATNRAYATELAALGLSVPAEVATNYAVSLSAQSWTSGSATMSGYTVTATPLPGSAQADDGELKINQFGLKSPVDKW